MSENDQIEAMLRRAAGLTGSIAEWIEDHGDATRATGLLARARVDNAMRRLQRLPQAAERRPCLAVFGGDGEVGGAAVAALAGLADGSLVLGGGDVRLPAGSGIVLPTDRLGIAAVIRYSSIGYGAPVGNGVETVDRLLSSSPARFKRANAQGVRLDILSYADLISIFARAYHTHVQGEAGPRQQALLRQALEEVRTAETTPTVEAGLTVAEVGEIRARLERAFHGHDHVEMLAACGFWPTFSALAPRSSRATRRRLASLIWGGHGDFDAYFAQLGDALQSLNFASDIFCAADAVSETSDGILETAHRSTVLAASTMLDAGADLSQTVEVRTRHSGALRLSRAVVSAIAAEVTVQCETASGGLTGCDVLQVPLARISVPPRLRREAMAIQSRSPVRGSGGPTWIAAAILEAKSVHLAERLLERRDADGLVVVVQPERPVPLVMAPMLTRWVDAVAGRKPAERDANGGAVVLAAVADPMKPDQSTPVWSSLDRFWKSFAPECGWLDEWGHHTKFDRVVLLAPAAPAGRRNGRGGSRALTRIEGDDGTEDVLIDRTKVRHATLALDEAMAAADGGLRFLVQTAAAFNLKRLRLRQLSREASDIRQMLSGTLRRSYLSGHADFDPDWRRRAGLETQAWLRGLARSGGLGRLIHALMPSESTIGARFATVLTSLIPRTAADAPLVALDPDQAEEWASRLARAAYAGWVEGLASWAASDAAAALTGGTPGDLDPLIDEITNGAARVDVARRVSAGIARGLSTGSPISPPLLGRLSRETAEIFASQVSELGFAAAWSVRHPRRPGAIGAPLFDRSVNIAIGSDRTLAARLADQYADDWCEAFPAMVEENLAAARIMRMDERDLRELAELVQQLEIAGTGSIT